LAVELLATEAPGGANVREVDVDGETLRLGIARA
jgi:hypothetical protein